MAETLIAPYGSWRSPITSALIAGGDEATARGAAGGAAGAVGLLEVAISGDDVYWIETRPAQGGRAVVVRRGPDGATSEVTPPEFSARSRVHEYGGGAFVVHRGELLFTNLGDQRLYRQRPGEAPRALTAEGPRRYADAVIDAARGRLICVREDHGDGETEPVNAIVAVALDGSGAERVLVAGSDFYAAPRLSRDGRRLAWLAWDHPNMPWDGCALWRAELDDDGALSAPELVAGGPEESIFQPEWSPEGVLHFVSDRSGWWNLYRLADGTARALCPMEAEFGQPQWVFGQSTYGFEAEERIVCAYTREGRWHLARLGASSGRLEAIGEAYSQIDSLRVLRGRAVFIAASPSETAAVRELDLASGRTRVLRRSLETALDPGYLSAPRAIAFPTSGGATAHAYYYPPCNRDFRAPDGERPPLVVRSHGGPTSAASTALKLGHQYWTSRGFALLDVNYGGSSGYGRAYRQRLDGQWGVVDLDDCVNGALHLSARGEVDGERLVISGGSAGGYTTLCALTFREVFKAGASYYGIGDLEALARHTHKFESRYLDHLVGPYPEQTERYRARSPIHHAERLSCPVIFFQGLEDRVVPPAQAEAMVAALRAKGVAVAYLTFAGEQHGFRGADAIRRALDGELYFYSRVFGFAPAETIEPVAIENL